MPPSPTSTADVPKFFSISLSGKEAMAFAVCIAGRRVALNYRVSITLIVY